MTRIRRWTCGLWRYLRGYHRHPGHAAPRRGDPFPFDAWDHTAPIRLTDLAAHAAQAANVGYPIGSLFVFSPGLDPAPEPEPEHWPDADAVQRWLDTGWLAVASWLPRRPALVMA